MPILRIVSVNDVYLLENLPRLRTLVDEYRAAHPNDPLIVALAGDFLAPSLLSSLDAGRGMVDCLNAVGVTHIVLGNHEDDLAPDAVRSRLAELRAVCLGTNVRSGIDLPKHDIVDIGQGVTVGIIGVVMADPSFYRGPPFGGVDLAPTKEAALAETRTLLEQGCSAVVPLTHQSMAEDRELAKAQRDPPFPVIVGGHEHTAMLVDVSGTWIVKAGADATHAVITEISWTAAGVAPVVSTRLEVVSGYADNEDVRRRVSRHMTQVRELERATLLRLQAGETLSSVGARSRQTSIGTLICSRIRDALGADVCVFNGGGIRGSRTYSKGLTYGDIEAEVPFDNEVVIVTMPGGVLRDVVAASRAKAPAESGAFLQVDDGVIVEGASIVSVGGGSLDVERDYRVAIVRELLLGLDRIEPLSRWTEENPARVPPVDSGREPKVLLVQSFAVALWHELGGFEAIDANEDDRVTESEVAAAVVRAYPSQAPSPVLAEILVRAVDTNDDGLVSRQDVDEAGAPKGQT